MLYRRAVSKMVQIWLVALKFEAFFAWGYYCFSSSKFLYSEGGTKVTA